MPLTRKLGGMVLMTVGLFSGCMGSGPEVAHSGFCEEPSDLLVYGSQFADIYGLPPEGATELSEGLLAIRGYWTEFAHARGRPYLQVQIYIDRELGVSLQNKEGSLAHYESYVRSGFEYFSAEPGLRADPQQQHKEFYNRLILHGPESGTKTEAINRYKVDLSPGITAIEFSTAFRTPFDIYFYTGLSAGTDKIDPLFYALTRDENTEGFLDDFVLLSVPEEFKGLMALACAKQS